MSSKGRYRKRSSSDYKYYGKKARSSDNEIIEFQKKLPIYKYKLDFLKSIEMNQVVILTGETGCGKSTQIPQYLLKSDFLKNAKLACTQPRRVGAISLAQRVSDELNSELGETVGYSIRFESITSQESKIIYMTDGVLLRELQDDNLLSQYKMVMLDEAHERTIQTDALFGILKRLLRKRKDLKVIVSSATLNADKFSSFFDLAPVFKIPGRLHEVKIKYCPKNDDYVLSVAEKILRINNKRESQGDILAFLPGQEEIEECCKYLEKNRNGKDKLKLLTLPAYSALPKKYLSRIFDSTPKNRRKVVIATNIAETSLTIEGIKYVVDSGLVKQKSYNPLMGIDQLILIDISQAQADQRAGRAGRMEEGYCYRLYSEKRYINKFKKETVPEIKRANLSNTVLQLMSVGVGPLTQFDFIDHPGENRIEKAMEELIDIGALDKSGELSKLGKLMAAFPLDPMLSKILVMSCYKNCSEEMLTIVAMLCVQNIFDKSNSDVSEAFQKKKVFHKHHGDHITFLNIYLQWRDSDYSEDWCVNNCVRYSSMVQVQFIRNQLMEIMLKCKLELKSCGKSISLVQNTLSFYYFRRNAAKKESKGYRTLADDQLVYIHPNSVLFEQQPNWVIFHDIVVTSEKYMRIVTKIGAHFLKEHVPHSML